MQSYGVCYRVYYLPTKEKFKMDNRRVFYGAFSLLDQQFFSSFNPLSGEAILTSATTKDKVLATFFEDMSQAENVADKLKDGVVTVHIITKHSGWDGNYSLSDKTVQTAKEVANSFYEEKL